MLLLAYYRYLFVAVYHTAQHVPSIPTDTAQHVASVACFGWQTGIYWAQAGCSRVRPGLLPSTSPQHPPTPALASPPHTDLVLGSWHARRLRREIAAQARPYSADCIHKFNRKDRLLNRKGLLHPGPSNQATCTWLTILTFHNARASFITYSCTPQIQAYHRHKHKQPQTATNTNAL